MGGVFAGLCAHGGDSAGGKVGGVLQVCGVPGVRVRGDNRTAATDSGGNCEQRQQMAAADSGGGAGGCIRTGIRL